MSDLFYLPPGARKVYHYLVKDPGARTDGEISAATGVTGGTLARAKKFLFAYQLVRITGRGPHGVPVYEILPPQKVNCSAWGRRMLQHYQFAFVLVGLCLGGSHADFSHIRRVEERVKEAVTCWVAASRGEQVTPFTIIDWVESRVFGKTEANASSSFLDSSLNPLLSHTNDGRDTEVFWQIEQVFEHAFGYKPNPAQIRFMKQLALQYGEKVVCSGVEEAAVAGDLRVLPSILAKEPNVLVKVDMETPLFQYEKMVGPVADWTRTKLQGLLAYLQKEYGFEKAIALWEEALRVTASKANRPNLIYFERVLKQLESQHVRSLLVNEIVNQYPFASMLTRGIVDVKREEDGYVIYCKNEFLARWIRQRYFRQVEKVFAGAAWECRPADIGLRELKLSPVARKVYGFATERAIDRSGIPCLYPEEALTSSAAVLP